MIRPARPPAVWGEVYRQRLMSFGIRSNDQPTKTYFQRNICMAIKQTMLTKLRRICRALPDAVESIKWGKPHFCVREKIFAGCDDAVDRLVIGFKLATKFGTASKQRPRVKAGSKSLSKKSTSRK